MQLIRSLGCKNCKEKRLKCDEAKPTCQQCEKKGVSCKGYQKDLKWRPQEDSFKNQTVSSRPRKSMLHNDGSRASLLTLQGSNVSKRSQPSPSSPALSQANTSALCNALPISNPDDTMTRPTVSVDPRLSQQLNQFATHDTTFEHVLQPFGLHDPNDMMPKTECGFPTTSLTLGNDFYDDEIASQSARTAPSIIWSDHSPSLAERLLPNIDLYARPPDLMDYQSMEPIPAFQSQCLLDQRISSDMEGDVEEVVREPVTSNTVGMIMSSPTNSDSSSSSGGSWCDSFADSIFANPRFHPYSQEMLLKRFDSETCGILSIKNGPLENPWKMMLWPLARTEPALHHAISAMTAFHASKDDRNLRHIGVQHMTQSVQHLSQQLVQGFDTMRIDTALSTTLVLAFCESWDLLISTGIKHLRGAKDLILRLMENCSPDAMSQQSLECTGFLVRTWVYMDVIARLTSLESDDSEAFDILGNPICQISMQGHGIDPLMGCASTMFPTIGRVGNLIRKVRRTRENSLKVIEEANILKAQLEKWTAPRMFEEPQDKSTDVEQALWTAEAYRSATLLYLYQAVPEISLDSVTDKIAALATKVLTNLANVPVTSGAAIVHIFPLLAAGCEATDPDHRDFISDRWLAMMRRMKIGNIDKCLEVVKDVWERRDSHEAQRLRNKAFVPDSNIQASDIPTTIIKRSMSIEDHPYDLGSQTTIEGTRRGLRTSLDTSRLGHIRRECSMKEEKLDFDLTVRGRRHWAGVMKDKTWEGESSEVMATR